MGSLLHATDREGGNKMEFENIYDEKTRIQLKDEFPQLSDVTYLDHAGATLFSKSQLKSVTAELRENLFFNPHTAGTKNKSTKAVAEVRSLVLRHMNADPEEYSVIFTSGATAGIKIVGECFGLTSGSVLAVHEESHTSAMGIREFALQKGADVKVCHSQEFENLVKKSTTSTGPNLFCYPAMSNFNGKKLPLKWVNDIQKRRTNFVLLDTASFVSTNGIDLRVIKPDFLVLSFYKLSGYPTGLGVLIVKTSSAYLLKKTYFGGGTVEMNLVRKNFHVERKSLSDKFEDGTVDFLGISSVKFGIEALNAIPGGIQSISQHTFSLARYAFYQLSSLRHFTGGKVVHIYNETTYDDIKTQGGALNFNILSPGGVTVGYSDFSRVTDLHQVVVRTGCFCNTGSCQKYLEMTDDDILKNYQDGHVCGDDVDIIDDKPTGSIRISFGYMSTKEDVDKLVWLVSEYFQNDTEENKIDSRGSGKKNIKVSGLFVYPVKSCAGISVNSWPISEGGLLYDRQWMLMQGNKVITQKKEPMLSMIQPSIDRDRKMLILSFPGENNVEVSLEAADKEKQTDYNDNVCIGNVCGEEVGAISCGLDVSDWLERILGMDELKLVKGLRRKSKRRQVSNSLANDSDCLILNADSINNLADKVKQTCEKYDEDSGEFTNEKLTQRFRGNIVIEGIPAFEEESWTSFTMNGLSFSVGGACKRCQMITVEQGSGQVTKEPLRSLAKMKNRNFNFGIHTSLTSAAKQKLINIGDSLELLQ